MAKDKKLPSIPGFEAVSPQVLVRESPDPAAIPDSHPEIVLIFGWGDCLPKHIAKFSTGFADLYPSSKQVVILGPIWDSLMLPINERIDTMKPVVDALRHDQHLAAGDEDTPRRRPRILAHTMSNTGAGNYAVTLNAFRIRHGFQLPHDLLIHDSTPGSPYLTPTTLYQWSRAMTIGTSAWFPWPAFVTQGVWGSFLVAQRAWGTLAGREFAGVYASRICDDDLYEDKQSKRLYLYGKADDLISWKDVEMYKAGTEAKGWQTRGEMFEGSGHVGHMKLHPEQYWKAVADAWTWVNETRGEVTEA